MITNNQTRLTRRMSSQERAHRPQLKTPIRRLTQQTSRHTATKNFNPRRPRWLPLHWHNVNWRALFKFRTFQKHPLPFLLTGCAVIAVCVISLALKADNPSTKSTSTSTSADTAVSSQSKHKKKASKSSTSNATRDNSVATSTTSTSVATQTSTSG